MEDINFVDLDQKTNSSENISNKPISKKIGEILETPGIVFKSINHELTEIDRIVQSVLQPFIEVQREISHMTKSSLDYFQSISKKIDSFVSVIEIEYNVNRNEFNESISALLKEGYFLPFSSTPKDYIRLHESFKKGNIEKDYLELFENNELSFFTAEDLVEMLAEFSLNDWKEPLILANDLIKEKGIESYYQILLPFYFSYMENMFRFTHEDRGKSVGSFSKLVEHAKENIDSSEDMSIETKEFYNKILEATKTYFFSKFQTPEFVNRNSVTHGYSTPVHWKKIDFYKSLALLSTFVYLLLEKNSIPDN